MQMSEWARSSPVGRGCRPTGRTGRRSALPVRRGTAAGRAALGAGATITAGTTVWEVTALRTAFLDTGLHPLVEFDHLLVGLLPGEATVGHSRIETLRQ